MQHLHECLRRDIPFNPAQTDQFVQMEEPQLPDFLYHFEEDEDPVPCFTMTNPYEALLIHDPGRTCVCVAPDMLYSFQPPTSPPSPSESKPDFWYPQDTGKINLHQMVHWSIMSDRPSYTIHPQPPGVTGSDCMDFSNERLDHQVTYDPSEFSFSTEGKDTTDYLTHQSVTIAEFNINRYFDDLLDVSTTYLGTDLVQRTDVFNAQPSFPITFDCHTNGELLGGEKLDILLDTGASKSYMSKAFYMRHEHLHHFPKFQSAIRHLQVGNGALVPALFVISLVFKIQGHIFDQNGPDPRCQKYI